MSHEIEVSQDGEASFFSVLETAWHGLGAILAEAPKTVKEALTLCRADYETEVRPVTYTAVTDSGDTYPVTSTLSASIVRTDTNAEVGTASPSYHPMQNSVAFSAFEPLIDSGLATIETGGVLRDGADAFMLIRWNLDKIGGNAQDVFTREGLRAYGLATNSHSGRRGIVLMDTDVRVVCANTVRMAMESQSNRVFLKHQRNAGSKLIEGASTLWASKLESIETTAKQYEALRARIITAEEFAAAVLDVIAPVPVRDGSGKFDATVIARAEAKREVITTLWTGGKGHTGDLSAWEAYNGAVEALDHNGKLWKTQSLDARAVSLMDGPLATLKSKVYGEVLALV